MQSFIKPIALIFALLIVSCELRDVDLNDTNEDTFLFDDATETNLPISSLNGLSMDAAVFDADNDGDIDIIVAIEFGENIILINDGNGKFTDESDERLPRNSRDSEDIGIADFDNDGDYDVVIVSEDDRINEFYLNDGSGYFTDESDRIIVQGTSNAVAVTDINDDGFIDIIIGNAGQNTILINNGSGYFSNETGIRMPAIFDITQDLELGDIDNDGDLDLLVANEDENRLLINRSNGIFTDQSATRLIYRATEEETRQADLGDIDNDGDLDILFANVVALVTNADPQNRLLINDGIGIFIDETYNRLPEINNRSFDGKFIDINSDGYLDIVTADSRLGSSYEEPFRVFINNGSGGFANLTSSIFPETAVGKGFDIEAADFNGDNKLDLYLASRGSTDRLLLHK